MMLTERLPGMRQVPSVLLFSMDTEDEGSRSASTQARECEAAAQRVRDLVEAAQASTQMANVLTAHVQDDLVGAARALGYAVKLRDCVGGGAGASCLRNLRHSFLILSRTHRPSANCSSDGNCRSDVAALTQQQQQQQQGGGDEVIVDPTFKDQFLLAHPSPRYCAVLDALPPVFVGTTASVAPLVTLLCAEMAAAFAAAGAVVPPWRSARSMLSKWMPRRSLDLVLPAVQQGPGQGAAQQPTLRAAAAAAVAAAAAGTGRPGALEQARMQQQAQVQQPASSSAGLASCPSGRGGEHALGGGSSTCSSSGAPSAAATAPNSCCGSTQGSPTTGAGGAPAALLGGCLPAVSTTTTTRVCAEPLQRVVGGFGAP